MEEKFITSKTCAMKSRTFNKKASAGLDVLRIVWKNGKEKKEEERWQDITGFQ